LALASERFRRVGHRCVSVRPPMTRLTVKIQEPKVVAQVGFNDRLDLVADRVSSTDWRQSDSLISLYRTHLPSPSLAQGSYRLPAYSPTRIQVCPYRLCHIHRPFHESNPRTGMTRGLIYVVMTVVKDESEDLPRSV
jgi:hypothetical protein